MSHLRRPDGGAPGLADIPFSEKELCPPNAFEDLTPDDQHFHEATGNEGASFDRSYVRAGLVLWPRARQLAVLNQAGLSVTLPHLEGLAARWRASAPATESPLWQEADELARHMLRTWPSWQRGGRTRRGAAGAAACDRAAGPDRPGQRGRPSRSVRQPAEALRDGIGRPDWRPWRASRQR